MVQNHLDAPAELIGGGTPEIQLTVIASMVLGLPAQLNSHVAHKKGHPPR